LSNSDDEGLIFWW